MVVQNSATAAHVLLEEEGENKDDDAGWKRGSRLELLQQFGGQTGWTGTNRQQQLLSDMDQMRALDSVVRTSRLVLEQKQPPFNTIN